MRDLQIAIVDVGHGCCCVVLQDRSDGNSDDRTAALIVDAPVGPAVSEFLTAESVMAVGTVVVSHSHADHAGGVLGFLLRLPITCVQLNPAPLRGTRTWTALRHGLRVARARFGTRIVTAVSMDAEVAVEPRLAGAVHVYWPPSDLCLVSEEGDDEGKRLPSNATSVVIGIGAAPRKVALLMSDVGADVVRDLLSGQFLPEADLLVFPHHGGKLGAGPEGDEKLAELLARAIKPTTVAFTNGRRRYGNPRSEILRGVLRGAPEAHVACSQLAERCHESDPPGRGEHLARRYARGKATGDCCAGTLVWEWQEDDGHRIRPSREAHERFVKRVDDPRCMRFAGRLEEDEPSEK